MPLFEVKIKEFVKPYRTKVLIFEAYNEKMAKVIAEHNVRRDTDIEWFGVVVKKIKKVKKCFYCKKVLLSQEEINLGFHKKCYAEYYRSMIR